MQSRFAIVALVALTSLAVPAVAQAQEPAPVAPSRLLTRQKELDLTPSQVRELSLLATQVRRYQQAVLRAPSKQWVAVTKGVSREVASERALALLSPQQRELALQPARASAELASTDQATGVLD